MCSFYGAHDPELRGGPRGGGGGPRGGGGDGEEDDDDGEEDDDGPPDDDHPGPPAGVNRGYYGGSPVAPRAPNFMQQAQAQHQMRREEMRFRVEQMRQR